MTHINIEDVQSDMAAYLKRVEAGETIVILRAGKPVAEVKPVSLSPSTELRPFGLCKGKFTVPDDFDAPLPEELLRAFEGK
ncbi:MAG: type II toxin-antitoxin system Phd/YefM family antitoxin [Deltaproteobacteria bacterium]|nr:type II toxin-antitoxin system Phd/YefM family antitoxin [Deltaproteobacteria bacterium]